jgi:glycosyltransferase involved in cell wall biosynthesis
MRVGWIVPGELSQPTGGYVYDRLIVERLRAAGDEVFLSASADVDVLVGDGLAIPELGEVFEATSAARVLLVHHLTSWELERADAARFRALEARVIAASDALIVTSQATVSRILREHPKAPPCDVIVPGADRLPRREHVAGSGVRLCMIGSLIPRKRVPLVLDALDAMDDARFTLRIIGDPTRDPEHAREIAARVGPGVKLLGVVDDETLASELASADALVLASSLEGYGMVLTEALHAGVPLIASREALAAAELDPDGVESFESRAELAELLQSLPARLDQLRRAAQANRGAAVTWHEAGLSFRAALTRVIQRANEARSSARGP